LEKIARNKEIRLEAEAHERQTDIEEPLDQIECDWTGNMNMNVAITNYIQFEMKTPPGVRHNKEDSQRIFEELNSTEEGYFYYSHLCIGIISYVLYSSTEVTEIT